MSTVEWSVLQHVQRRARKPNKEPRVRWKVSTMVPCQGSSEASRSLLEMYLEILPMIKACSYVQICTVN